MSLRSADELFAIADSVLDEARLPESEVVITERDSALTRFARNTIHQNVAETSLEVRLRLVRDGRTGVAAVRGEPQGLPTRLYRAAEEARRFAPKGEVSPIPRPDGGPDDPVAFSAATAAATPEWRADSVATVTRAAAAADLEAFGALSTGTIQTCVVNGLGVRRHARTTSAGLVAVCRGEAGSGYAERHSADVDALDVEALASEVVDTCRRNQEAQPLEPGDYEVVLQPYAVAEMLSHLSWLGFSALAVQEKRSFMRFGEKLMHEDVTISDDAGHPGAMPFPFDDEGVSTRVVTFVDHGVCHEVMHDSATAMKDGVTSTGHALPMPNSWGPYARHLVMAGGDRSLEDLIGGVRRGLLVTRFWYVRDVHPLKTIITGMTREGTFLIENGRIVHPVRDLRFTQSIVGALAGVRGIGRDRVLVHAEDEGGVLAPALHLGGFSFTS